MDKHNDYYFVIIIIIIEINVLIHAFIQKMQNFEMHMYTYVNIIWRFYNKLYMVAQPHRNVKNFPHPSGSDHAQEGQKPHETGQYFIIRTGISVCHW